MLKKGIYITGDKHGNFKNMLDYLDNHIPHGSVVIILGDVGLNYYSDIRDLINKEKLNTSGYTFICLRGNHEARPTGKEKYITNDYFGGTFIVEDDFSNILYMIDGNDYRFTVNEKRKKCLAIGGAYSVDKYYRLAMLAEGHSGYKWFEDEQLNEEERKRIVDKIKDFNSYNYIFSHTCPFNIEPRDMFLVGLDQATVDDTMEHFLQDIADAVMFDIWYCGHWHTDRKVHEVNDDFIFMYNDIKELGE